MTTLSNPQVVQKDVKLTGLATQYVFPGATVASPQIQRLEVPDNKYIGYRNNTGTIVNDGIARYGVTNGGSDVIFTGTKIHNP